MPLFGNKRFMLDEMTKQNVSKFAIFYIYKSPKLTFSFCATLFIPNECPWSISLSTDNKYGIFWSILLGHFMKHKHLISEEWSIIIYFVSGIMTHSIKNLLCCCVFTLQKSEIYAWWNDLAKCFKICNIFGIRKPTYLVFFVF